MKIKKVFTHPLALFLTVPIAWMLWSMGRTRIIWGITTDFCAVAFSYWTILVLLKVKLIILKIKVKIPEIFFILGALFFALMGTLTLAVYRPFFSFPTIIHFLEAIFGYGYLLGSYLEKKSKIKFLLE